MAGWGLVGGSRELYPLSCLCLNNVNFPSLSSLGSGLSASLKACDMQSKVDLTESDLMVLPFFPLPNLPSRRA
jgi:hypothetical protein